MKDAAPNVFVEPVVPASQNFEGSVASKEVSEHLSAGVPCVWTSLVERLQCFDNEAGDGQYGEAMLARRVFDWPKVTLVESFNEELTDGLAIASCFKFLVLGRPSRRR